MRAVKFAALFALVLAAASGQLKNRAENPVLGLTGRIAARYGAESFSGNLAWRHAERNDEMLIPTPIGQGVARIVREGEAVTLTTAEPKEYRATDAETLTEQVLGFRLPLAGLADRVRARPSGAAPLKDERSADGRLMRLGG